MSAARENITFANKGEWPWRGLGFDVGWQATSGGVIRCHSVYNGRSDVFNAVEGLNLGDIRCDSRACSALELLQEGPWIRHVAIRPPRRFGPERLYMTAQLFPTGEVIGTFCALKPNLDDLLQGQAALLSQMSDARNREESYRQEAEVMLQGLRLLLSPSATIEKLECLADLLVKAIRGKSGLVLRVAPDGTARRLDGTALSQSDSRAVAESLRDQDHPVTIHDAKTAPAAVLRKLTGFCAGEVALILLPFAAERFALLCGADRSGHFAPEDVGFSSRFTLILKQAVILKEEQDKLVQSAKLSILGQMSANLAHELRQPLNTIGMAAQNLELMGENGPIAQEVLQAKVTRILGQVDRASQIMDRVRRFSRTSGDDFATVGLLELAQRIQVFTEHLLLASGVRLEIDIPPGLCAVCDTVQIEQVLANLVRNAVDALAGIGCARATENGVIALRARKASHGIVIRVEDNGPGFPAALLQRSIETFFTTKSADSGTGLGLSICNTIAREHAGRLVLGNRDGGGACVELHLPERGA